MKSLTHRINISRGSGLLLVAGLLAAACASTQAEEETSEAEVRGQTGWATDEWADRADWYLTQQGSHLIEYDVFLALERPGRTAKFASRSNLESKGFVYPPRGASNLTADPRLPLGVLKDASAADGRDYVGFTCATCHTGEIRRGNDRIVIDGGQAPIDFETFLDELHSSLVETSVPGAKQSRFCATLGGTEETCTARLREAKERIEGLIGRNTSGLATGPSRLDAFTRILNEVFGGQLGGETPKVVQNPVSLPQVWDAPRLSCVQTNCSSTNSLSRNIGEVLGVFGHVTLGANGVSSTVKLENLYKLEKSLESLRSPKWNERMFGRLDPKKRAIGEQLYASQCASCHTEPYKTAPLGDGSPDPNYITETAGGRDIHVWRVVPTAYREVGTDPSFIDDHAARKVNKPELTGLFDTLVRGQIAGALRLPADSPNVAAAFEARKADQITRGVRTPEGGISSLLMLGAVTASVEFTEIPRIAAARGVDPTELRHELEFYRGSMMDAGLMSYRARPLNGIAFTAPYGHVGSWPTLADMLEKEENRPTSFPVRARSFDPDRVGLDITPPSAGEAVFMFDATKPGNLSRGHTYGVNLSPDEKLALLEYLKSL